MILCITKDTHQKVSELTAELYLLLTRLDTDSFEAIIQLWNSSENITKELVVVRTPGKKVPGWTKTLLYKGGRGILEAKQVIGTFELEDIGAAPDTRHINSTTQRPTAATTASLSLVPVPALVSWSFGFSSQQENSNFHIFSPLQ